MESGSLSVKDWKGKPKVGMNWELKTYDPIDMQ